MNTREFEITYLNILNENIQMGSDAPEATKEATAKKITFVTSNQELIDTLDKNVSEVVIRIEDANEPTGIKEIKIGGDTFEGVEIVDLVEEGEVETEDEFSEDADVEGECGDVEGEDIETEDEFSEDIETEDEFSEDADVEGECGDVEGEDIETEDEFSEDIEGEDIETEDIEGEDVEGECNEGECNEGECNEGECNEIDCSEWLEDGVCVKCDDAECDGSCKCKKCGSVNCIGDCEVETEDFLGAVGGGLAGAGIGGPLGAVGGAILGSKL